MSILKLIPASKEYLWGGKRLVTEFGKECTGEIMAESWELSCHPDGPSIIANGEYKGKTLIEYMNEVGKKVWGSNCRQFSEFPILIKFIDAKQNLSVQVHPSNEYALKHEKQYGKTEMWYVVDCDQDAVLSYGLKRAVTKKELVKYIEENSLTEILNVVPIKPGDVFFIEAGTLHAIGAGTLIAEIQQNSNVTYRVYDYDRVGADGRPRELHVEKAQDVTTLVPSVRNKNQGARLVSCDYFTVDKLNLDKLKGMVTEESFVSILVLSGTGAICAGEEKLNYQKGDSFFLPAGLGGFEMVGDGECLMTQVDA